MIHPLSKFFVITILLGFTSPSDCFSYSSRPLSKFQSSISSSKAGSREGTEPSFFAVDVTKNKMGDLGTKQTMPEERKEVVDSEAYTAAAHHEPEQEGLSLLLFNAIGKSTRWTVALSVAFSLVTLRDPATLSMVIGSVCNAVLSKILKKIVNQSRPELGEAVKESSGMPSSHAMSLFFFAGFLSIEAVTNLATWCPVNPLIVVCFLYTYAVIASAWRVFSELHTLPQVAAGALCGTLTGVGHARLAHPAAQAFLLRAVGPAVPAPVVAGILFAAGLSIGFFQKALKAAAGALLPGAEKED